MDPDTGIPTGVRWRDALQRASARCEAVILLLSNNWSNSKVCRLEYDTAEALHKQIFCARLEESPADDLTAHWQRCDLFGEGPTTAIDIGDGVPVEFATGGLKRLFTGVRGAGIGAESFKWPPADDPGRAPYRGWEPLTGDDAAVFFGRDAEIVLGLDALRGMRSAGTQTLFVVLGPSGAGKSSFLRAGLLPRLRRDDRRFVVFDLVRPERQAITGKSGLAQAIHATRLRFGLPQPSVEEIETACLSDVESVRRLFVECQQAAADQLIDHDDEPSPTIVLPLDQAEELFSTDASDQAPQLLSLIGDLADSGLDLIVAATIRTDRYETMQTAPQLGGLQTVTFNELKPMPDNQFAEVITRPAERASRAGNRLRFDPELVKQLLIDCTEGADSLPLLSLTLARLHSDYDADGLLELREYAAMGGMTQVVQTEVDSVLSGEPPHRSVQLVRAAWRIHSVAGHHQSQHRSAHASRRSLDGSATGQSPADRRACRQEVDGQGRTRRRSRRRGRAGKPAAAVG